MIPVTVHFIYIGSHWINKLIMPFVIKDFRRHRFFTSTGNYWSEDLKNAKRFRSVHYADAAIEQLGLSAFDYIGTLEVAPDERKQRFKNKK